MTCTGASGGGGGGSRPGPCALAAGANARETTTADSAAVNETFMTNLLVDRRAAGLAVRAHEGAPADDGPRGRRRGAELAAQGAARELGVVQRHVEHPGLG